MRFLALFSIILVGIAGVARAETIVASVNGMVCAICVTGIEKTLKKEASVAQVKVDLDGKSVTVQVKSGKTLDDATVTKRIVNAGYQVTGITRTP